MGPPTPEQLYRLLAATNNGPAALWAHQADVLRAWHGEHIDKKDVAIELPTGAGKTLVGGLVADFLRRRDKKPVAYLCPNNLLARQTADKMVLGMFADDGIYRRQISAFVTHRRGARGPPGGRGAGAVPGNSSAA